MPSASQLASAADAKNAQRLADIAQHRKLLADVPALLANPDTSSIDELSVALSKGLMTSEALVAHYARRALDIGLALEAITESVVDSAIDAARKSDARRASGTAISPLDGIPISVKDNFMLENTDSTCGCAVRCNMPSTSTAVTVELLKMAGAVPVVKSNVPQCLMVPESMNRIFGCAINPHNAERTPGGSSGGESALIAAGCAPLGVGGDIGGSLRIPAHFAGIYAFKPTPQRVSRKGMLAPRPNNVDGQSFIHSAPGPMGRCTEDLAHVMRIWSGHKYPGDTRDAADIPAMWTLDPLVPRQPWDEAQYLGRVPRGLRATPAGTRRLRVGVMTDDGFFMAAMPCVRATLEAAQAMASLGHEVVDWQPMQLGLDTYKAAIGYYGLMGADGKLRGFKSGLAGEALHPVYATLDRLASFPDMLRPPVASVLQWFGYTRLADLFAIAKSKSAADLWDLQAQMTLFRNAFLQEWSRSGLDVLLCPGLGLPALRHGGSQQLTVACSYTFLFNSLHFPAGTVPVTFVTAEDVKAGYVPPAGQQDVFATAAAASLQGSEGLPVGVQVVGLPFADETVLYGMQQLETGLKRTVETVVCPPHVLQRTLSQLPRKA